SAEGPRPAGRNRNLPGCYFRRHRARTMLSRRCEGVPPNILNTVPLSSRHTRRLLRLAQASPTPHRAPIASNDVAAALLDGPGGRALARSSSTRALPCRLAV